MDASKLTFVINLIFVLVVLVWGFGEIRKWRHNRRDAFVRKCVSTHIGRIYHVERVSKIEVSPQSKREVTIHLTRWLNQHLTLNITDGHCNLTDRVTDLEGKKVIVRYQENPCMQRWSKSSPKAYMSYWVRLDEMD